MIAQDASARVLAYVVALMAFVSVLPLVLARSGYGITSPWVIVCLAIVAALAERGRVQMGSKLESSISLLPTVFAAVLLGPLAALPVAAASMLGSFAPPYLKVVVYTCTRAITGGVAGVIAVSASRTVTGELPRLAVGTAACAVAAAVLDVAWAGLTYWMRGNRDVSRVVRAFAPLAAAFVPLYAPVVILLALAYEEVSPFVLPLFFAPALAAQRLFGLYQQQRQLTDDLVAVNKQLERAHESFTTALVTTLDARDRYTAGHSAAVAIYARDIAARMGLNEAEQALVHQSGLVHDIGKIGLPAGLLEKPGALTLEERRQMEKHSAIGERILGKVAEYGEMAKIVRHHHERVDGQGYPDGLSGLRIPILSRIIAVADAYNAMTSDRPYRDAMPTRVARLRLAQAVETQFDTAVVAAFEAVLAGASEAYRCGKSPEFRFDAQQEMLRAGQRAA